MWVCMYTYACILYIHLHGRSSLKDIDHILWWTEWIGGGGHSLFITQTNLVFLYNGPKCGHVFVLIVFRYLMPYLMCHLHLLLNIYYHFIFRITCKSVNKQLHMGISSASRRGWQEPDDPFIDIKVYIVLHNASL